MESQDLDLFSSQSIAIFLHKCDIITANVWQGESIIAFYGDSYGEHHLFSERTLKFFSLKFQGSFPLNQKRENSSAAYFFLHKYDLKLELNTFFF